MNRLFLYSGFLFILILIFDAYDRDYNQAKIETAAFYAEQLLPQVSGLLPATVSGAESLYAIKPERLRG